MNDILRHSLNINEILLRRVKWSVVTLCYNSSQQCHFARSIHANYNKRITVGIKSKTEDPFRLDHLMVYGRLTHKTVRSVLYFIS